MTIETWLLVLLLAGLLFAGFVAGNYWRSLKSGKLRGKLEEEIKYLNLKNDDYSSAINDLKEQLQAADEKRYELGRQLATSESQLKESLNKLENQKDELEKLESKFIKEFQLVANKLLESTGQKLNEKNKETIDGLLRPLKENIKDFEEKVDLTHKESIRQNISLKEQLQYLKDQNLKITKEAENLTKALRGDSKMQGNWGELILERVLEKSGLEKDIAYFREQSHKNTEGSIIRPDVIVSLPNGSKLVVDSKVSLSAYNDYVNSDEAERPLHLKKHLLSINKHVEQLSSKKYEDIYELESPDFVLMFIPIETAFSTALNADSELWVKAFDSNIVIVTPSTLLATLRTVSSLWDSEKQRQNAIEIARQAGNLYDKFVGFVTDLTEVGRKMDMAKRDYEGAMNKLVDGKGDLISRTEKLKILGAKAKKSIPENLLKRAAEAQEEAQLELEDPAETKSDRP